MGSLVISLDFELFWGVSDSRTIQDYGKNVAGVWQAVPRLLSLFRNYEMRVTWATVGMIMCRDYRQWQEVRPAHMPGYVRTSCSNYEMGIPAMEHPELFFARPLVESILESPGQELGTHTYSHFYCDEPGATVEQFAADLHCAKFLASELGTVLTSLVFPRNQVRHEFLKAVEDAGIRVWRGNPLHPLYRNGHRAPGGVMGRALRLADSWIPVSGTRVTRPDSAEGMVNVPASLFLRPYSNALSKFDFLKLFRIKKDMTRAAANGGIYHLWWHPHNFGANLDENLFALENLLMHFKTLSDKFGMTSHSLADFGQK